MNARVACHTVFMFLPALVPGEVTIVVATSARCIKHRYADGYLESVRDMPAVEGQLYFDRYKRGYTQMWFSRGFIHRGDDKPAIVYEPEKLVTSSDYFYHTARSEWFKHGLLHRSDGPAVVGHGQDPMAWATDGVYRRVYDMDTNHRGRGADEGDTARYLYGRLHSTHGPAIVRTNGDREWWLNGRLHRVSLANKSYTAESDSYMGWTPQNMHYGVYMVENLYTPAIVCANGNRGWYVNGMPYISVSHHGRYSTTAGYGYNFDGMQFHITENIRLPFVRLSNGNLMWLDEDEVNYGDIYIIDPPAVFSFRPHELTHFQGISADVVYYNGVPRTQ